MANEVLQQILVKLDTLTNDVKKLQEDVTELKEVRKDVKALQEDVAELKEVKKDVKALQEDIAVIKTQTEEIPLIRRAILETRETVKKLEGREAYLSIIQKDQQRVIEHLSFRAILQEADLKKAE